MSLIRFYQNSLQLWAKPDAGLNLGMVTFLGEWLGVCPSLPSLATGGGSPVVHIDAPVDAELDQHHGRSRAAFDVAVELPLSRLSLGCRPSSETRNAIPPLYFPPIHLKEIAKPLSVLACYCIEPLFRDLHNNNIRLVSKYQQFRTLPLCSTVNRFRSPSQSALPRHSISVTRNQTGRLESSDIDFSLLVVLSQAAHPIPPLRRRRLTRIELVLT
ncbi:uncharacterized protein FFB20_11849 [Fusarium fujikuroi]|nr:uncharacterized protein FFC1_04373 [Fusarium fujikuroi]SCO03074.1 uncharacterized protein FFB20_11849 [Fusarium fujikuroi]